MKLFRSLEVEPPPGPGPTRDQWVEALCIRIERGDELAFREFFDRFADRIFRYALTLTRGNEDLSRELMQGVMIKSARAFPKCFTENQLWSWLTRVARNGYIDILRREKKWSFDLEMEIKTVESSGSEKDCELLGALEETLKDLPTEEREFLEAIYEQKLSHKEAARLANTTPKAVESRLARLRRKLREEILEKLKAYALI